MLQAAKEGLGQVLVDLKRELTDTIRPGEREHVFRRQLEQTLALVHAAIETLEELEHTRARSSRDVRTVKT